MSGEVIGGVKACAGKGGCDCGEFRDDPVQRLESHIDVMAQHSVFHSLFYRCFQYCR